MMSLSDLIKKGGLRDSATATVATVNASSAPCVAPVAGVAVAGVPEPLSELSPDEETRILAWMKRISGIGPSMIAAALEECRTDLDTRRDYLERSEEVTEVPK